MKLKIFFIFSIILLIFLVGCSNKPNYDEFAKCLNEKGAIMYGTYWCSHCQAQKREFSDSFQYINYVECSEENDKCITADIQGFPTWIINGEKYEGKQELSKLGSLAKCELPKE